MNTSFVAFLAACTVAASAAAELPFLEPTRQEWDRMTPAEREVAREKLAREWERQRELSTKLAEDQKSGVCHVHKIKMDLHTVTIRYGLPTPSGEPPIPREQIPRLLAAGAAEFPNANDLSSGGCVVSADSPKTRQVYMCTKCIAARQKFYAALRAAK